MDCVSCRFFQVLVATVFTGQQGPQACPYLKQEPGFQIVSKMLREKERSCVKDILQMVPETDVRNLAQTVTQNLVRTTTLEGKCSALWKYLSECVNLQNTLSTEQTTGSRVHVERKKNSSPAGTEIACILWNLQVGCHVHKKCSHVSVLSQNSQIYYFLVSTNSMH